MKRASDAFEQRIRESLDQFEVPYNSADWAQLEKAMDGPRNVGWWITPGMIAALVAGTLVVGGGAFLLTQGGGATTEEVATTAQPAVPTGSTVTDDTQGATDPAHTNGTSEAGSTTGGTRQQDHTSTGTGTNGSGPTERAANTNASNEPAKGRLTGSTNTDADQRTARIATGTSGTRADGTAAAASGKTMDNAPTAPPKPAAEMTFKASVSKACPGEEVTFKVENMPTDGIYLWNFGDGSFSNKPNPEHTYTKPGNYQVMLSMSAAGVGTIHNKPSSDIITIHEAPNADFHALKQEYEGHMPSVHFENRSNGAKQYHWDFGDGTTSTVAHPDHVYKKKGVYPVRLTVTSERGCMDLMEKEVRVDRDYNLDAPAAFAPAAAETFMPEALRTLGVKFHLMVYSADGQLVYETTDATKPWTGRLNNRGEVMTTGEYVWVVDIRERLHLAETYTGKVTLKN